MSFNIILIIIIIIIIYFCLNTNDAELFISYYKCDKPINKVTLDIFKKYNITKDKSNELHIPCDYTHVEKELQNFNVDTSILNSIYAIDGCDKLVSKNNLWKMLVNQYGKDTSKTIMPYTYIISNKEDIIEFKNKYKKNKNQKRFILKKNLQRKKGIYLSNNYYDILKTIYNDKKFKIIQEFKESFLVKDRKFNLRIYYLVVCKNNHKQFYYHSEGKCIYANKNSHKSFNIDSNIPNIYDKNYNGYDDDRPFYLNELYTYLDSKGIHHNLKKKIEKVLNLLSNTLTNSICKIEKLKKYNLFQLFGLDIIVDANLNPYILELNKGPDLKIGALDNIADSKDYKMKQHVLEDMFELIGLINVKKKNYFNNFISLQ